jgi:hypothetical protein
VRSNPRAPDSYPSLSFVPGQSIVDNAAENGTCQPGRHLYLYHNARAFIDPTSTRLHKPSPAAYTLS